MAYNDRGRFGGGGHGGGRRPPMQMHQTTCSECRKSCEVPFRPSGDKPVFCSDCFKGKNNDSRGDRSGGRSGDRSGGGRDFDRRDSGGRRGSYSDRDYSERPPVEMHEAICSDCGKECEVPFKPSGDNPIYCDKCLGRNKEIKNVRPSSGGKDKLDERLTMINIKRDRILKVLDVGASGKTAQGKKPQEKISQIKPEEKPLLEPTPKKSVVKKAKAKVKKAKM